ncbi:adenine specific DNA methyltransferase [Helicobacter pylori PeCan4]|nr:adenine specific DNA methyltransferase [Helicobacter pylori PeCan4]
MIKFFLLLSNLQSYHPPFNTNIALILSRQAKASLGFDGTFISKEASDLNIFYGGGGTAFPLFCIT